MKKALPIVGVLLLLVAGFFTVRAVELNGLRDRMLHSTEEMLQMAEHSRSTDDMAGMQSALDHAREFTIEAGEYRSNRNTVAAIAGVCALAGVGLIVVGLRKRAATPTAGAPPA